jgi:predicted component of type VI protein secretion system
MAKMKHMFADHIKEIDDSMAVEILDSNRTIFVAKLNEEAGDDPELTNCRTIQDVFAKYRPKVEAEVKNDQGESESADLSFNTIKDFSVDSVIGQSKTLESMRNERLILSEFLKAVGSNATLRKALSDPAQRQQLLGGFKAALTALGGAEE